MNEINFNCPHCKQLLEAPEELFGQGVDCPSCNGRITVPQPEVLPPTLPKPAPISVPQPSAHSLNEQVDDMPSGKAGKQNVVKNYDKITAALRSRRKTENVVSDTADEMTEKSDFPPLSHDIPYGFFGLLVEFGPDDVRRFQLPTELQKPLAVRFFGGNADNGITSDDLIKKWVKSLNLCDFLLRGVLTRHSRVLWVLPKPSFEQFYSGSQDNDEQARMTLKIAMKQWQQPQQWVAIGDGLAKEFDDIGILYNPKQVILSKAISYGFYFGCAIGGAIAFWMYSNYDPGWNFTLEKGVNPVSHGVADAIFRALMQHQSFGREMGKMVFQMLMMFLGAIPGGVVGLILGYVCGLITYRYRRNNLPRPPEDGF